MATETTVRTITAEDSRDLALYLPHGHATATVDPDARTVSLTLRPVAGAPAFPAAPIARAYVKEENGMLAVHLPAYLFPNVAAADRHGLKDLRPLPTGPVAAEIILPPGACLNFLSEDANLSTEGLISAMEVKTGTGTIDIDRVGAFAGRSGSGPIRVRQVEAVVVARTVAAAVRVDHHCGHTVDVSTDTGSVMVHAEKQAVGGITIHSPGGKVAVTGRTSNLLLAIEYTARPEPLGVPAGDRG